LDESYGCDFSRAIIFNEWRKDQLGPLDACAFVRHAVNVFYHDFTLVETNGRAFIPVYTFKRAVLNFRSAVLRYGQTLKEFKANREFSTLTDRVPEEALNKFSKLISFDPGTHHFWLTDKFKKAVADAEKAADDYQKSQTAQAART